MSKLIKQPRNAYGVEYAHNKAAFLTKYVHALHGHFS